MDEQEGSDGQEGKMLSLLCQVVGIIADTDTACGVRGRTVMLRPLPSDQPRADACCPGSHLTTSSLGGLGTPQYLDPYRAPEARTLQLLIGARESAGLQTGDWVALRLEPLTGAEKELVARRTVAMQLAAERERERLERLRLDQEATLRGVAERLQREE